MKKLNLSILSAAAIMGGMLLTSCLGGDGTNKYTNTGVFTVEKDGNSYILYRDLGGIVYPTTQSVYDLTGKEGFKNGDRVSLDFSYTDNNLLDMPGKGKYIKDAELIQGQRLPQYDILLTSDAQEKNLLDPDSIFGLNIAKQLVVGNDFYLWAYRGFLTVQFNGTFSVVSNKGVYPTLNMVFNPEERIPNTLNLKLLYNRHSKKDAQTSQQYFYATYPLSKFTGMIPGNDSINVKVEGEGLKNAVTFRLSRKDLNRGDYIYY